MPPPPRGVADLPDWIVRFATISNDAEALLDGVGKALVRDGLPVWHISVAAPAIDPLLRGAILNWWRDGPTGLVTVEHGKAFDEVSERSPIQALQKDGLRFGRWRLAADLDAGVPAALHDLKRRGGTDYVMALVVFAPGTALEGAAIGVATDHAHGFQDHAIRAIETIVPALGLAVFRHLLLYSATTALSSYLGPLSGAGVLAGDVRRGQGRTMAAAILLADLSGFTAMADREDPLHVVRWLNEHLEAIGDPVTANGGEILKFLGDGLLAVFPAPDGAVEPCGACHAALRAAEQALARNARVNARRQRDGGPQLEADIALHFGEVVYGNVGTAQRLDLTTIGRAVNEASRIEKLCDEQRLHLLASAAFARRCGRPLRSLGTFRLRGIGAPIEVMTPASGPDAEGDTPGGPRTPG